MPTKPKGPTGRCPFCARDVGLRNDGVLRNHRIDYYSKTPCDGSGARAEGFERLEDAVVIPIVTHYPTKWRFTDIETGETYRFDVDEQCFIRVEQKR